MSFQNTYYPKKTPESYIPWVRKLVAKLKGKLPASVEWDDLVQAGMVGLLEAWQNYDASKGVAFESFAYNRVQGAIYDWLRGQDTLPKDVRSKLKEIEAATSKFVNKEGRFPSEAEISNLVSMELKAYQTLLDHANAAELYSPTQSEVEDGYTIPEGVEHRHPETEAASNEMKQKLIKAFDLLEEREAQVVQLYYVEDMNLREIGMVLNVSEARASQILKKAMLSMKSLMS